MISRPKLGICFSDLYSSQSSFYFIMEAAEKYELADFIVFYEALGINDYLFPCSTMQITEAWSFKSPLIATNISTAIKILNCPAATSRYLYCWDLEWLRLKQKNYHELVQIYRNPNLKLIARSDDHKTLIEDCWNTKVSFIAENWTGILNNEQIISESPKENTFLIHNGRKEISD